MAELGMAKKPFGCKFENSATTTKIGGKPFWVNSLPPEEFTRCKECNRQMVLLLQLFAPADTLHRLIYVFLCPRKRCVNRKNAIKILLFSTEKEIVSIGNSIETDDEFTFSPIKIVCSNEPEKAKISVEEMDNILNSQEKLTADDSQDKSFLNENYERFAFKNFLKFSQVMALEPKQFFRYDFGGKPLHTEENYKLKDHFCQNCKAELIYEFQIMPFTFRCIEKDKLLAENGVELDWGTISVFVCPDDCIENEYVLLHFIAEKAD